MRKSPSPKHVQVSNTELLSRTNILRSITDPRKDIDGECGYPSSIEITDYKFYFERVGAATRLVSIYPEECWSSIPAIYEVEDETVTTPFEKKLKVLIEENKIFHYLQRIDILSGIGKFGILLIGINDGLPLNMPIQSVLDGTPPSEEMELLYLKPFDQSAVTISTWDNDPSSPRYGHPLTYNIQFSEPGSSATFASAVHWTRIVHFADDRMNSDIYGTPRLECAFNQMYDLRKIAGGSAEMFWKGGFPGFSTKIDADAELDKDATKAEIEKYQAGLGRWLLLQGVEITPLSAQVSDPTAHIKTAIMLAAMAKGIPYRIFIGTEEAQLAGSQDAEVWIRRCYRRCIHYLTPLVISPFLDRLIVMGILPAPSEENGYTVEWANPDRLTEEKIANIAEKLTNALSKYVSTGSDIVVPPQEFLTLILGMTGKEAQQIMDAQKKYEPLERIPAQTTSNPVEPSTSSQETPQNPV